MTVDIGRVGLWTFAGKWNPEDPEHREALGEVEELGYGALWLGAAAGDLQLASGLLDATERLVVATGIINIWDHDAAELAATYRRLATGHLERLLIGLGASHAPAVGERYRKPYSKVVSYLDELDGAAAPLPESSRVLAALGPRMVALAGERSRGAHPYLTTPEHTARAREILGAGPVLAPEQKVVLETDPERARSIARDGAQMYLGLPNYLNNLRRLGFAEADFADGGSDRLIDALVAWGDADTVLRRVQQHQEAGADHVGIQVLTDSPGLPRQQWRLLAEGLD
jgi:probable F420-dependent oxidoreductase